LIFQENIMKFSAYAVLVLALVVTLVPNLHGQQRQTATAQVAPNPDAPDFCSHQFTVGSGNNSLQYCVSDNGNITALETPFGHTMIGAGGEGYGLCQESPATEYHDYASSISSNWNAAQILSKSGSTIKISRTTSDGNWTLVQTITKVAASTSIKVVMGLTNNQSVDKVAYLLRFADIDPDGDATQSSLAGGSVQSAWSWDFTTNAWHRGLQLLNSTKSPFGYQQGFAYGLNSGPNACAFAFNANPNGVAGGGGANTSISYAYAGPVAAHQTLTVTMTYRGT
jgi:hypothetical protein